MRPVLAEGLGTFWIVFVVAGLAAQGLAAPGLVMGAAAGLAYLATALTLGQITTGHFNPALTVGLRLANGFGGSLSFTLLAQVLGASLALLMVGPPPPVPDGTSGWGAMVLLVPLVVVPTVIHVTGMQLRAEAVAYANAVALATAVALMPGGHASLSAAHATAAWLTGDGAPIALWRIWLATGVAIVLAHVLWTGLAPVPEHASDAEDDDEEDGDEGRSTLSRTQSPAKSARDATEAPAASEATDLSGGADARSVERPLRAGVQRPLTRKGRVRKNTPLRKPSR